LSNYVEPNQVVVCIISKHPCISLTNCLDRKLDTGLCIKIFFNILEPVKRIIKMKLIRYSFIKMHDNYLEVDLNAKL